MPIIFLLAGIFVLIWPSAARSNRAGNSRPRFLAGAALLVSALAVTIAVLSPVGATLGLPSLAPQSASALNACTNTVVADVVALDQPFYYNRLGAIQANGMIYALRRDVVENNTG